MKSKQIQLVTDELVNQDLFGIKYKINSSGVNIFKFTPLLLNVETHQSTYLSHSSLSVNQFQVSLVSPFFLPLHKSLNGLYEKCLSYLSNTLEKTEEVNMIWIFQKRSEWRDSAISMYENYLGGDDNPSEIDFIRRIVGKIMEVKSKFSSPITSREYSLDVEDKILDEGYVFQCIVEISSNRINELSNLIQTILLQYDYYNGLEMSEIEYQYPYVFQPTNQILSKSEILSLLSQTELTIDTDITLQQDIESSSTLKQKGSYTDRINLLPKIKKEEVEVDKTIIPRLAESLKRVGIMSQARLHNESIEYGARLNVVYADLPKNKNFSDIAKKQKDIQVALGVSSLSIEQGNEPGKIKYSIPHGQTQIVSLREVIERDDFQKYNEDHELAFVVGLDEINSPIYLSLKELRHILIVGSQGSGKSVFVNQLITTLLITHTPDELNFILIDPKQVELTQYEQFPHTREVITNMQKAMKTFNGLIKEMEDRYTTLKNNNVKDIWGYNEKNNKPMPYLIVVIEEWADLFATAGKDAEEVVLRLGQKARAAGIFLAVVTQRPSAKILSGDIKANIQSKFSFNLGSNTNYRTVFDSGIPFQLLGKGDGVFSVEGYHKEFQRFQSPIITTNQLEEECVYERLAKTHPTQTMDTPVNNHKDDDSLLNKLKRTIANTKETKLTVLREKLEIKTETLSSLMNQLVTEGWLIKHKSKSKGYELAADEAILNEWKG